MPLYDYDCQECGLFTTLRPMTECELPHACPDCGGEAPRVIVTAPRLAVMDSSRRTAAATNERSAHAPRSSSGRHPSGCACCSSGSRSRTRRSADGAKSFPANRPWMINH